jgi:alkylation response protein AidB-like acyl-CoA dehydrogenase
MAATTEHDVVAELRAWLDSNWDPELTVAEWWSRLGLAGWSAPSLPENAYGRGLSRNDSVKVAEAIGAYGALAAPGGLGLLLAAPTIATHGTQEQIDLYVRDIVTGQKAWCQLFSEPVAGSDLAGLQTRAVEDGEEWIVNGQKVWTSGGQIADLGMLIARTNSEVPKHQGISYFAIDMHQPGMDIRPLTEMTGRAMFNEVFMTDARVPSAALISDRNNGWAVANTTLAFERAGLGSGGGHAAASAAAPGTVAGHLEMRVGDFVGNKRPGAGGAQFRGAGRMFVELAKATGAANDPTIRQDLVRLHTLQEIGRMSTLRLKALKASGGDIPGFGNISKLSMSDTMRLQRDLGLRLLGAEGMLHAYTTESRAALDAATGKPLNAIITELALFAQAPPIYGGTDQVQRNIIGERVLGLPKEPSNDRTTPFSVLPKNA